MTHDKRMKSAFYLILCLLTFVMCNKRSEVLPPELVHAESLMLSHPDSALTILDSMKIPSPEDELQYATWCLLTTQARDKNYLKHTSDSLINRALEYFEKQDDPLRKATALYYEGRVNYDMNRAEEAATFYLRARDVAKNTTDYNLLCLINSHLGTLYLHRDLCTQTTEAYKLAHDYSLLLGDSATISYSFSYLGRASIICGDMEKAVEYYKEAIDIAEQSQSLRALTLACVEVAMAYTSMGALDSSLYYQVKSLGIDERSGSLDFSQIRLGIGETYRLMGQFDSAYYYLESALNTTNVYVKKNASQELYYLFRDFGKYKEAIVHNDLYRMYMDSVENINRSMKVAEIQAKYDRQKLLNENNQLLIQKSHFIKSALSILILLLILIGSLIFVYQRKLLRKERDIQKTKKQLQSHLVHLRENESVIRKNEGLIKSLSLQIDENTELQESLQDRIFEIECIRQKNESLLGQNKLLQENIENYIYKLQEKGIEIEAYECLAVQNTVLHNREKFLCNELVKRIEALSNLAVSPRYITDDKWTEIFDLVNMVYEDLTHRLQKDFPTLTDSDLRICCLIKLHLGNSVIATLTGISSSSVTKRKQRLKERISQHLVTPLDRETSVDAFIWEY